MSTQANQPKGTSAPPAAYVLVAIGGGVVGHDYARWLEVNPIVGAVLGAAISAILTRILYHLVKDPEGSIRKTGIVIGAVAGIAVGGYVVASNSDGFTWIIGSIAGGVLGGVAGYFVAVFVSFGALVLLFLSQGPVGFFIRSLILNLND